jgi:hypothetical protein
MRAVCTKSKWSFLRARSTRKPQIKPDTAPTGTSRRTFSRGPQPQASARNGTAAPKIVPSATASTSSRLDPRTIRDRRRIQEAPIAPKIAPIGPIGIIAKAHQTGNALKVISFSPADRWLIAAKGMKAARPNAGPIKPQIIAPTRMTRKLTCGLVSGLAISRSLLLSGRKV